MAVDLTTDEPKGKAPLFDDILFTVASGSIGADCFLSVNCAGQDNCVPEDGALDAKRILGMLAQLLAHSTSLRDITNAPQARAVPQDNFSALLRALVRRRGHRKAVGSPRR